MAIVAIFGETSLQVLHLLVQLRNHLKSLLQNRFQLCYLLIFIYTPTLPQVEDQHNLLALLTELFGIPVLTRKLLNKQLNRS